MELKKGFIALMGSGELTATMVEVHKDIISRLGREPKAVFLDTPAGFQLNADELSQRALEYFRTRVQYPMSVVSYKSRNITPFASEQAFSSLRDADYILVGPGSPTYAVAEWKQTPIPEIIKKGIDEGACFVAASAAALTVGRFTMPVYEIYKVGKEIHWIEGIDILGHYGINAVVIPHWNNAEGGTHDTRRCFMGESRFRDLMGLLPEDVGIIGLDEHTACIIDLASEVAEIRGIGGITIRNRNSESSFQSGERIPLSVFCGEIQDEEKARTPAEIPQVVAADQPEEGVFWDSVHAAENVFHKGLEKDPKEATNAILELDRLLWKAQTELENVEFITQAREIFRELLVLLGTRLAAAPGSREECISALVDQLLELRAAFRKNSQWKEADAIRICLQRAGIVVEDTADGSHWRISADHDMKQEHA